METFAEGFFNLFFISFALLPSWSLQDHVTSNALILKGKVCISHDPVFVIRCCNDYYKKDGVCIECPRGTIGVNCSEECPIGFYGRLCLKKCVCETEKKCDPVKGCVHVHLSHSSGNETIETGNSENSDDDGNSLVTILVIIVGMATLLLLLLGLLIRKTVRSSEEGVFGKLHKVFYWRRTYSADRNEQQVSRIGCNLEDDGVYDDIRVSGMLQDCGVESGVGQQCKTETSDQDTKTQVFSCPFATTKKIPSTHTVQMSITFYHCAMG